MYLESVLFARSRCAGKGRNRLNCGHGVGSRPEKVGGRIAAATFRG